MEALKGALSGIKVVTCSTAVAGTVPYMFMADLGAEVIKIEVPNGGDNSRKAGVIKGEDVEKNSNIIHEAADVFYHLIMYLEANNIKIEDVIEELNKRKK